MFNRQSLHIALLVWGGIFCLIAAFCIFISRGFPGKKKNLLLSLQLSGAVLLFADAIAWGFRGSSTPAAYYIIRISNYLVFTFSDVLLLLFHGYVCCCLFPNHRLFSAHSKTDFPRIRIFFVCALTILCIFLVLISQITHLYYYFDHANFYHRAHFYIFSVLLPLIGLLTDLTLILQYRSKLSHLIFASLLAYITLPIIAAIIQLTYYGISLNNIAISISLLLMFLVAMTEQNREMAKQKQELADMRISMMLSQIAPHFIYNTLSTIQGLCETDPAQAKEVTGEFADYLRGNLDALSTEELVPFEKELSHTRSYLSIEQKRFGARVQVKYDIEASDFLLPVLTLQPLVENAVKYGLCKKDEGGTVQISTHRINNAIVLTVQDDGVGFTPATPQPANSTHAHVGLENVRTRLYHMCSATLQIKSIPMQGTTVTVTIPQK